MLDRPFDLSAPKAGGSRPADPDAGTNRSRRRRRRTASLVAAPRPGLFLATDPILRWGPAALLAFAPLAWGSVEAWSELVVVVGAAAIGAVCAREAGP